MDRATNATLRRFVADMRASPILRVADRVRSVLRERWMRHDGYGGQTAIRRADHRNPGASRPVRRIVLIERADR
jgi:hypothetical protein